MMKTITLKRLFPDSEAFIVHQDGSQLTAPSKPVEIILHTRDNEPHPCCAELISGEHYAEIELSFEAKELRDFGGVVFLPREVGEMLTDAGYLVPEDCYA